MNIFGGFLMIIWLAGFFLALIWFILPFVIFGIKSRTEEVLAKMTEIDSRLSSMEKTLSHLEAGAPHVDE